MFVGGFGHGIKLDFKLRFDEFGEVEGFFTFEIAEDKRDVHKEFHEVADLIDKGSAVDVGGGESGVSFVDVACSGRVDGFGEDGSAVNALIVERGRSVCFGSGFR